MIYHEYKYGWGAKHARFRTSNLSASAMRRAQFLRNRRSSWCSSGYTKITMYSINNTREGIRDNCSFNYTHETGGF